MPCWMSDLFLVGFYFLGADFFVWSGTWNVNHERRKGRNLVDWMNERDHFQVCLSSSSVVVLYCSFLYNILLKAAAAGGFAGGSSSSSSLRQFCHFSSRIDKALFNSIHCETVSVELGCLATLKAVTVSGWVPLSGDLFQTRCNIVYHSFLTNWLCPA